MFGRRHRPHSVNCEFVICEGAQLTRRALAPLQMFVDRVSADDKFRWDKGDYGNLCKLLDINWEDFFRCFKCNSR